MADSPDSTLSELSSTFSLRNEDHDNDPIFASSNAQSTSTSTHQARFKRQRINSSPILHRPSFSHPPAPYADLPDTDISSDTSGDVPDSPTPATISSPHLRPGAPIPDDESSLILEQVTICCWTDCHAGDLGTMDTLVDHIHDEHIGTRQKRYACEWESCTRKGMPHASGYALRAHMRSHTKEKPFFCQLPECDRSFTRSDALAKHMRTVHETDTVRPGDPAPRVGSGPPAKVQRLKLVFSSRTPREKDEDNRGIADVFDSDETEEDGSSSRRTHHRRASPDDTPTWPADLHFSSAERTLTPSELFSLLRRQLHWAQDEGKQLAAEVERLDEKKFAEWRAKEGLLEDVMDTERRCGSERVKRREVMRATRERRAREEEVIRRERAAAEAEAEAEAEAGATKDVAMKEEDEDEEDAGLGEEDTMEGIEIDVDG